jgi:gamma-glutamylaminecyclotransferase
MREINTEIYDDITSGDTHLVFVYGTLRKECGNHYLLNHSKFFGTAKTKDRYALYASEIPFLSRAKSVSQVTGEVYVVDTATLKRLDQLEGHPDWYRREQAEVVLDDGTELSAWVYFNDAPQGKLIESGDFLEKPAS